MSIVRATKKYIVNNFIFKLVKCTVKENMVRYMIDLYSCDFSNRILYYCTLLLSVLTLHNLLEVSVQQNIVDVMWHRQKSLFFTRNYEITKIIIQRKFYYFYTNKEPIFFINAFFILTLFVTFWLLLRSCYFVVNMKWIKKELWLNYERRNFMRNVPYLYKISVEYSLSKFTK